MLKYILIATLSGPLLFSQHQIENKPGVASDTVYKNDSGDRISKNEFLRTKHSIDYFNIFIDSIPEYRLIKRDRKGKIPSGKAFYNYLSSTYSIQLDTLQPIVIIYHPGLDTCNSSGRLTRSSINQRNKRLSRNIKKFTSNELLFIAQESSTISKRMSDTPYFYDVNRIIEKQFFEYHYPCGSYLIVDYSGNYVSYLGEYANSMIVDSLGKF